MSLNHALWCLLAGAVAFEFLNVFTDELFTEFTLEATIAYTRVVVLPAHINYTEAMVALYSSAGIFFFHVSGSSRYSTAQ